MLLACVMYYSQMYLALLTTFKSVLLKFSAKMQKNLHRFCLGPSSITSLPFLFACLCSLSIATPPCKACSSPTACFTRGRGSISIRGCISSTLLCVSVCVTWALIIILHWAGCWWHANQQVRAERTRPIHCSHTSAQSASQACNATEITLSLAYEADIILNLVKS